MTTRNKNIQNDELTSFGQRLRYEREKQDLSRPALSKLTGKTISARVIAHLEDGNTEPKLKHSQTLAEVLEVDEVWLNHGSTKEDQTQPNHGFDGVLGETDDDLGDTNSPDLVDESDHEIPDIADENQQVLIPSNDNQMRLYVDAVHELLELISAIRNEGFLHHSRKMPGLIEEVIETGKLLELSEVEELASDHNVNIEDDLQEEAVNEVILRLLDTALLGVDLYQVDTDNLLAFAKRNRIHLTRFNRRDTFSLIAKLRQAYWDRALEDGLTVSTFLSETG